MSSIKFLLGAFSLLTGGSLRIFHCTHGTFPYINASIIVQLLTVIIPRLKKSPKKASRDENVSTDGRAGSPSLSHSCNLME